MISYQGWNFLLCVLSHEAIQITGGYDLYDTAMVFHHFIACFFSFVLLDPYAQFFVMFYYGIIELTNIPLTIMDIFKYFNHWAKQFPLLNQVTRYTFAISFIFLRLICWPIKSWRFISGSIYLLYSGEAHDSTAVALLLISTIAMTFLQFFWGQKIFASVLFKKEKEKRISPSKNK